MRLTGRILIIAGLFPPYSSIGAIRIGKMAVGLQRLGWDVRVWTDASQSFPATLPVELDTAQVRYVAGLRIYPKTISPGGALAERAERTGSKVLNVGRSISRLYRSLICIPDPAIAWAVTSRLCASRLLDGWKPDLVYGSSGPPSGLLLSSAISRRYRVPWLAEYRDLWTDSAYYPYGRTRRRIDALIETTVVQSAAGIVTVSNPWAEQLRQRFQKPTEVVMNGYDEESVATRKRDDTGRKLTIVYTGMVYPGKRDPALLFEALKLLGEDRHKFEIHFYGRLLHVVREAAKRWGVADTVFTHDPVSRKDALQLQSDADVLLMLLWDDPGEAGVLPGKVFEYIATERPILTIGGAHSAAASLIRERFAGVVLNDAMLIAGQLQVWRAQKVELGGVTANDPVAKRGLARVDQIARLSSYAATFLGGAR